MKLHEQIKEDGGRALSEFTDADHSRRTYYWIIAGGLAINALSWIAAIITPDVIADWVGFAADLSDKVKAYLLAVPFWSTFVAAYSALRTRTYTNPTAELTDDDVMSSYRDTERNEYLRNRILLSFAVAAVNVIVLVFIVLTLR